MKNLIILKGLSLLLLYIKQFNLQVRKFQSSERYIKSYQENLFSINIENKEVRK
jgi:hypothetical protein